MSFINIMAQSVFYFSHPTSLIIAGPTKSGKTKFTQNLLRYSLIQPFPNRIIWLYKEWQPIYNELQNSSKY